MGKCRECQLWHSVPRFAFDVFVAESLLALDSDDSLVKIYCRFVSGASQCHVFDEGEW